jgi:hypothetical protein
MRHKVLIVVAALLAACGGDATTPDGAATSAVVATTTTMAGGTTSATTPTTAPTTATTPPTTTIALTTTTGAVPDGLLPDGRPATFVAITEDYRAVEVDTATGDILHVYGQTGTPADLEAAEEMPPNVLVGIWRTSDGAMVGISDCCEPAAGRVFFLESDATLGDDPYSESNPWNTGWVMSPSPFDNRLAVIGYELQVLDPAGPAGNGLNVWVDEPDLGSASSAPAWAKDEHSVYWIAGYGTDTAVAYVDLDNGVWALAGNPSWVGEGQSLDGIGTQESGNLVGFLTTYGDGFEPTDTVGVVFTPTGQLTANFPVETGSIWGGYDPSGRFLIYVDGDGTVRWQGLGQTGELATGFIFASW